MRSSKKSQFEVIGLLVIVILVLLGVIYVVQFVVLKPVSNIRQTQTESQFAAGFLNAFLETTTESCHNQQVKSLVHDCVSNPELVRIQCNKRGTLIDSCRYLNYTAFRILNQTLIKRNRAFKFYLTDGSIEYFNINQSFQRCSLSERVESKSIPLQVEEKQVELFLKICP
jgi:hypothetical protein